tara:strand:- start:517 stop:939 length:423 start_codon:yes stop_codon:yes gene_type:complete
LLALVLVASASLAADFNRVVIVSGGARHAFAVELAISEEQHQRGLMFREQMADDAGMLFLFRGRTERAFWMKNTLIPLDMLFIDDGGRIMKVHHSAVPGSLEAISSDHPVVAVLEINGGLSRRLGIKAGDIVQHPALQGR